MKDDFDISKLEKKKRGKINSKVKGNKFERDIAALLNQRFNTTDFCRTPGSGAFATTHKLPDHLKVYGDLITPKDFRFIYELKKGYNKEGICNIFNSNSILRLMIDQADRDSKLCNKDFILVLAQDRKDPIAILKDSYEISNVPNIDLIKIWVTTLGSIIYILKLKDLLTLEDSFFYSKPK